MANHGLHRPFKRLPISDQQRRRGLALLRQSNHRTNSQNRARNLASSVVAFQSIQHEPTEPYSEQNETDLSEAEATKSNKKQLNVLQASRLKGVEAKKWFSRQLMIHEWMVDVPSDLSTDWYVFSRPAGKRCIVVSSNGNTVSRLRNGTILHHFPSSLPCGARTRDRSGPAQSYCILDCIFSEADQTYYVIDMVCWSGYSLYDCSAEFRLFWLNSKLGESGACNSPSTYHRYRFSAVPVYDCNGMGLQTAYRGVVPYAKDGILFYNKHAHYQTGNTPLALVWKDEFCCQYVLDTDSSGQVPAQQQVVLELQVDGKLTTSDDPPIVLGCADRELVQKWGVQSNSLLRFAIRDDPVRVKDGKIEIEDMQFIGKCNRGRAFADSYSKVLFQYEARHSPLRFGDLIASVQPTLNNSSQDNDIDMAG